MLPVCSICNSVFLLPVLLKIIIAGVFYVFEYLFDQLIIFFMDIAYVYFFCSNFADIITNRCPYLFETTIAWSS